MNKNLSTETFCEYCNGKCMGHKKLGYNPADHFTVKGWKALGKMLIKEEQVNE